MATHGWSEDSSAFATLEQALDRVRQGEDPHTLLTPLAAAVLELGRGRVSAQGHGEALRSQDPAVPGEPENPDVVGGV